MRWAVVGWRDLARRLDCRPALVGPRYAAGRVIRATAAAGCSRCPARRGAPAPARRTVARFHLYGKLMAVADRQEEGESSAESHRG